MSKMCFLEEAAATGYRSNTMRMGYLGQDRTDLQRVVRELAKGMQRPTVRHEQMLKRAVRYLRYAPRVRLRWRRNQSLTTAEVFNDTDHAGCIRTRKSTSVCVVMLGSCLLLSLCRGQARIALSSGEAEYYGLVTGCSEGLGVVSLAKDFGVLLLLHIWMDATAGSAIGSRRGLGRVKHIDTVFLWVQEVVNRKRAVLGKVHASQNLSDVLTKPVSGPELMRFIKAMGYEYLGGRASMGYRV